MNRIDATLDGLVERARTLARTGERRILGITGSPGAGKSTLCAALEEQLGSEATLVGMDGFHLANTELRRLGRADRKGAPDTFDTGGYLALLDRLRRPNDGVVYAPLFDRSLEESIGSAIPIFPDTPLVITEGNYLLYQRDGWADVRARLDEAWYLEIPHETRMERLLRRRQSYGHDADAATAWIESVDVVNAGYVETSRSYADLIVALN